MNEHEFGRVGQATGLAGGGTGGASFAYSPDQLRDLADEWTDLALDYQNSLQNADPMIRVRGPGTEFVSQSHASAANDSGQAYLNSLQNRVDFCFAQAQKFQDTLDDYLGQEHRSVAEITSSGSQEGLQVMRHGLSVVVAGWLGVLALTGCTSTSPGRAEPVPTGPPGSTTETSPSPGSSSPHSTDPSGGSLPSNGAPKVRSPLDTSRFQQDPCLALTQAQARDLNVDPQGKSVPAPLGNACDWRNPDTGGHINLQFTDKDPRGLSPTYEANDARKWVYFVELPEIEGFPAVARSLADRRDKGECVIEVGVSDRLTFQLGGSLSRVNIGKKDPCEVTVMVAGMMMRTMKAGG